MALLSVPTHVYEERFAINLHKTIGWIVLRKWQKGSNPKFATLVVSPEYLSAFQAILEKGSVKKGPCN